jgi:glycosyltransferase involved in cell wall biosynthesis
VICVCICTYNRGQSLARTLDSLSIPTGDAACTEVLIVDNNSTDDTAQVVEAFRNKLPIRRVLETRQGASHARNRAVAEFCGDLLLFTDDDVRLDAGWLAAYLDASRQFPEADYFGGRILPDWAGAKPRWIGDEPLALIDGALVWFDHGAETRPFGTTEPTPFGPSFAVKRRLFERIGLFRGDLGPKGAGRELGEETEFLTRAQNAGAQGVYVGKALCFHRYHPRRTTLPALYRYGIASGRAHNAISDTPHRGGNCAAAWFVTRGILQLLRGRGDRFRQCIINVGIEMGTREPGRESIGRIIGNFLVNVCHGRLAFKRPRIT